MSHLEEKGTAMALAIPKDALAQIITEAADDAARNFELDPAPRIVEILVERNLVEVGS